MQGSRFAVNEKHHTKCFISHGTLGALSMHHLRAKKDCPTSASTHENMRWYTSGSDHSTPSILFIVMTQYTGWTQAEKHNALVYCMTNRQCYSKRGICQDKMSLNDIWSDSMHWWRSVAVILTLMWHTHSLHTVDEEWVYVQKNKYDAYILSKQSCFSIA